MGVWEIKFEDYFRAPLDTIKVAAYTFDAALKKARRYASEYGLRGWRIYSIQRVEQLEM